MTLSEIERLALLVEECAEVQQVVGKILRHGYESTNPTIRNSVTNRTLLESELGDVSYAINLMIKAKDVTLSAIETAQDEKELRVGQYLHYNEV